jgi:hypothetical protein
VVVPFSERTYPEQRDCKGDRMKKRFSLTAAGFTLAALVCSTTPAMAINLGSTAKTFAVLGGSTVTNTGATTVTGNLGVSPGSAITGSPVVIGEVHSAGPVAAQGQEDIGIAYGVMDNLPCDVNLTGKILGTSAGAVTLVPGVYCFNTDAQLTGTLTLDSQGDPGGLWVFQIGGTLTTAANSAVVMAPSSSPGNVFWQVTSSATLGTDTSFTGNLVALISVTLTTGTSVNGRVFARNGGITMDTNIIGLNDFVPSRPQVSASGQGEIHVPLPNLSDPGADGTGLATFTFVARRNVAGGPVSGFFEYNNPVQRLTIKGAVKNITVLSRKPSGVIKSLLFQGTCHRDLPQCNFAITIRENQPDSRDRFGITVTGALSEIRSQRFIVDTGIIRIDQD